MSSIDVIGMPASASASGTFGVTHPRARQQLAPDRLDRIGLEQAVAALGDHHRIDDDVGQVELGDRRGHRFDDRGVGEHADLDGAEAEVGGDRFDLRRDQVGRASPATAVTPSVFWAVTAVIADVPKTPCAANVLRSAWMPAPPPESLPAIVSAVRIQ